MVTKLNRSEQAQKTKSGERPLHRTKHNGRPNEEYDSFDQAFNYFNVELFGGELPPCLITLQRRAGSYGYYSAKRFETRDADGETDEIALNPATFKGRTDQDILSVLVHEMVHHWQDHRGKPSRNGYHN
jgi:hypothetical protein